MTEPVAYLVSQEPLSSVRWLSDVRPMGVAKKQITPLYTDNQLHPRVKLTQAEFDEWKELYYYLIEYSLSVHKMLDEILESFGVKRGKYVELSKRVYQNNGFMNVSKKQAELVDLFVNYNPDNPEKTIEIVPNMKWFVRSKKRDSDGDEYYLFMSGSNLYDLEYFPFNVNAKQFDTKEEAERWENPLTEAVQLPVEGE